MFIPATAEAGVYFPCLQSDYQLFGLAGKRDVTQMFALNLFLLLCINLDATVYTFRLYKS